MLNESLDFFLSRYSSENKNTDYISEETLGDLLVKHNLKNKYPPDFAIFTINTDLNVICTNRDKIRLDTRIILYENYFKKLLIKYGISIHKSITFLIDLSDGCQNRDFLFDIDKICLAPSIPNRKELGSLPISDPHYLHPNYRKYYDKSVELSKLTWKEKNNKFLYRGTVRPTLRPDIREGSSWITPRLDFCKKYCDNQYLDIGFPPPNTTEVWQKDYIPYFKEKLSREQMSSYKYNIIISGIGGNFDAFIWLILSNTTLLRMCDKEQDHSLAPDYPYWLLWFDSLCKPYEHYVPFNIDNFDTIITWCLNNESVCEKIANNAQKLYDTIIDKWDDYNISVIKFLIDL